MKQGKIKDFLAAYKDSSIEALLESGMASDSIKGILDLVVSEDIGLIFSSIFSAIAPRVNSIRMNYKENRFERNMMDAIKLLTSRIDVLENNYANLNEEKQKKFSGTYIEWLLDSLENEKQKEKVPYYANGYINLMTNDTNDNLLLLFFDTINQLTQLDVEVLRLYDYNSDDDIIELCNRNNLQDDQVTMIKGKLARLGLINSKNDEQRDKNFDLVIDYLQKSDKEKKSRNPKDVKFPNIKKPNRSISYSISRLGKDYLQLISDNPSDEI